MLLSMVACDIAAQQHCLFLEQGGLAFVVMLLVSGMNSP